MFKVHSASVVATVWSILTLLKMDSLKIVLLVCLVIPSHGTFHKFFSGQCPRVHQMPDFNIDRFLGEWYVIENYNDNVVACLRENFTLVEHESEDKEMPDMARNELEHEKDLEQVYQVKRSYLSFGGRQMMHETGEFTCGIGWWCSCLQSH